MQKIRSFHQFILEIKSILGSHDQTGHPNFLTMPTKQFFDQPLVYVNLYQHAKNQAISLICFGNIVDKKILQSDLLSTFWTGTKHSSFHY